MNRKGFTLIELLGCLVLLGVVLGIGLYVTKDTLSTALSSLTSVSTNQIYDAAKLYVTENKITWINSMEEYTCLSVDNLVDAGYFESEEVSTYKDQEIKIVRDEETKVINSIKLIDVCE